MDIKPTYEELEQQIIELEKKAGLAEKAKGMLLETDEKHLQILGRFTEGYFEIDLAGNMNYFNDSMGRILGYPMNELMGLNYRRFVNEETAENLFQKFSEIYSTGRSASEIEFECTRKDGTKGHVEISLYPDRDSKDRTKGFRGVMRDVTSKKQIQEVLRDSEELFRGISNSAQDAIIMIDNDEKIYFWNPAAENLFGYGFEEVSGKQLHSFIVPDKYQNDFKTGYGQFKESGKGLLIGKTTELVALNKKGVEIPIELSLSAMKIKGKWVAIGTIRDISERKKAEKNLRKNMALLRQTLGGIIQAMALVVETRDPYTAGHQRRVANFARIIAHEMGLSKNQIEGVRTAGVIHDIGKLNVPIEILAKPARLSELEYGLIKTHSEIGYNILKGIKFNWPIAKIAYQHHERVNGSGYPHNLSKDDIIIEARVLAVADVIEAMVSHRPYRPALGREKAIYEISNNSGILYDVDVVDACLNVIKENRIELNPQ